MSRILFAWELGAGSGHLALLRPVAEALLARGHQLTLAARDLGSASTLFSGLPVRILQAPVCSRTYGGLAEPPLNFAEILMRYSYIDVPMLKALLSGWRGLLELTGADRLVVDHAPTALLAARGMAVGRITFGNSFSVPPPVSPTPNMRDWITVPTQRLQGSDATVVRAINAALGSDAPPLTDLHQLFDAADHLFVGMPELDPYGPRTTRDYLGLHSGSSGTAAIAWPDGDGPRVFGYLRMDYAHIEACLNVLSAGPVRCLVNLIGAKPEIIARYRSRHLSFTAGHVDITAVAGQCNAVICHSGLGTVNAMLRAGRPLLLLPGQLEQFLLARNVEKLGVGITVHPETAAPDIAGALARLVAEPFFTDHARALAQRWSEPSAAAVIDHAVTRIEARGAELPV